MKKFDRKVLSLAQRSLEIEGVDVKTSPFKKKYILALHLQEVYGFTNKGLVRYLNKNPKLKERIGLQENINQSTIHRKEANLEKKYPTKLKSIKQAAKRTVWDLLVRDIDISDHVKQIHGVPESNLQKLSIPKSTQEDAIEKWVEYLLTVLDPLTFDRQKDSNIAKFVGLCAHCALQDIAPSGADDTIDHLYDRTDIPSGRTLTEYIRQAERTSANPHSNYPAELVNQFAECFDNFINLVAKMGFHAESQQLVGDTTPIPTTTTDSIEQTVGGSGAARSPARYGKRSFRFQYITTVNSVANFVLSVEPYFEKDQKANRLDSQLRRAVSHPKLDIDHVSFDKEYYSKEIFKTLRRHVGSDWVVCAKRQGEISNLIDNAKAGYETDKRFLEVGQPPLKPRPNAFAYPLENDLQNREPDDQRSLAAFESTEDQATNQEPQWKPFTDEDPSNRLIAYITDVNLTEENKRKLHVCYRNRRQIEPIIGQIRENHLAYTESMDPAVRYYFMAMAAMFYNFHKLINQHPSPEYAVPLEVTAKEWLSAIRNVTLTT